MRVIRNATLADGRVRDVRIGDDGHIDAVGTDLAGETLRDATGKRLLPGMIDAHVHFRQPGYGHKETWASGSRSAAAGGVTTVVDQPNTDPPTVDGAAFDEKATLARDSLVDFGINGGVTGDWDPEALFDRPLFALGEVFLADSTGDMGIDPELFERAVRRATEEEVVVTVHAEDASYFDESARERDDPEAWSAYRTAKAEAVAVAQAVEVGEDVGASIHIAHASTPEGIDQANAAGATTEVSPHHLFLSREDQPDLGTFGRMNPPLRSEERRLAVFDRVADGTVDIVATDHAPHTREEKDAGIWDAPSGVPGVETALPLLLAEAERGRLSYERVRDLTAANVADIFSLPRKGRIEAGRDADLVLVDPSAEREIRASDLHTNCDWTPFEGMTGIFPELSMVRGSVVWESDDPERGVGRFFGEQGKNVRDL
ncbi:dihydroorotase [Halanaeroarchaeum sulfurireducens]|uniref:Dihydroorotase n=1 Tax=Halanaeroarchaeum sulfurireducens TaxID=1604004 RepID=A0A0F7P996_9EURY|nr:dihydroorotase [Halanaeroarchaeum sulfurireducens]AKH96770.1 dihydroorotase [Halanaeroarchaeum sulfurireducens]ALG81172.1 dihydroorotase [Halanaeroarchaeum sulfurireducens]